VVDPGVGVADRLDEVFADNDLQPVAVLITHGHIDHTFSVAPVCGAKGIPAYIHPADAELLADPAKGLSADLTQLFGGRLPYAEPDDVKPLRDGEVMTLGGLKITVDHAPGHTGGSVMFRLPDESGDLLLSGDVLFSGSIGRTDLPGGDHLAMLRSLKEKVLPLADETVVKPGHGPSTTIGRERAANPYLREVAGRLAPPTKGL
jgi:glyoxylase-like metal-dependent hydrolase (beta-lactamase superfamily II)